MSDLGGAVLIGLAVVAVGMAVWMVVELIRLHRARLDHERARLEFGRALEKWKSE